MFPIRNKMLIMSHVVDFGPLERFFTERGCRQRCGEFMWMGSYWQSDGTLIRAYKHVHTRLYLNLDEECNTYAYRARSIEDVLEAVFAPYEAVDEREAVSHALSGFLTAI